MVSVKIEHLDGTFVLSIVLEKSGGTVVLELRQNLAKIIEYSLF